jgi:DNA-binding transcriptional MerR regulator
MDSSVGDRGYLSIGEVLALLKPEFADLTISKIRFLESQGLLDPERTPSGYRKFYDPDIERLRWILRQQHENYLPLKVIKGKLGVEPEAGEAVANGQALDEEPGRTGPAVGMRSGTGVRPGGPSGLGAALRPSSGPGSAAARAGGSAAGGLRAAAGRTSRPGAGGEPPPASVSLTLDELAVASGLSPEDLGELARFGLMAGKTVGGTVYYDEDALIVAQLAAGFMRYGVEARHLRMYRTSAEREASFFEQVVMPMLKQRNPQARRQAVDAIQELTELGQDLRATLVRQALRDYTGG